MNDKKFTLLIVKFLGKEATHTELEQLTQYLHESENKAVFKDFVKTQYLSNACMHNYNLDNAKRIIDTKISLKQSGKKKKAYKLLAVAACILVLLGLGINFYFIQNETLLQKESIVTNKIRPGSKKAILTLANGDDVVLEEGQSFKSNAIKSDGASIIYTNNTEQHPTTKATEYNYLTIPRGGHFFIVLEDGTKIWLNSESKLKYPTHFKKDEDRHVELLYGEAYFDVSPSERNNNNKFTLKTKDQNITVFGTAFNVSAYTNENLIATTLVEGKVRIIKGTVSEELLPNQQAIVSENSSTIKINPVDVNKYVSWIHGNFTFDEITLAEMMKILSRWYDVEVVFKTGKQKQYLFTGVLERTESLTDLLEIIESTSNQEVKFEINNQIVTIK